MNQQHGLSEEDLDLLPRHEYVGMESAVDCPVCLHSFENGDRCRSLPCRHIFHVQCVEGDRRREKKEKGSGHSP